MIKSPIYSFVDFENRLLGISLPAYRAQLAFQFYFDAGSEALDGGSIVVSVADTNNNILFTLNATIIDACAWGIITGLDESDFPIVVGAGQIVPEGTYDTIYDLWDALQAVGIAANSEVFIQCCSENLQDYTLSYTTAAPASKTININFSRGVVYVDNTSNNQEADFESNNILNGSCYKIAVTLNDQTVFSNVFKRISDTKYLTFLSYYNNEDGYDFHYGNGTLINKLWLAFYLKKPSPLVTRKIYRRSNKTYKVQFSTIEKELEATTEYFPEEIHDRLVVALEHDNKHVFSNGRYKVETDIFMNSDYSIGWLNNDIYDAPLAAQATFKVLKFFAGRNSNCERRPICIPLPTQGGGGDECVAVGFDFTTLPDATVGEAYIVDVPLTGDGPFAESGVSSGPTWMTITFNVDHFELRGTPSEGDIASGINISYHASNCEGVHTDDFSDTIDVLAAPPPPPDGNGNIHNGVSGFTVEQVELDANDCTPYTNFPLPDGDNGTFSMPYETNGNIAVRFNTEPLPSSITLEIIINGSTVESDVHSPGMSPVITSTNAYTIHVGDTIQINVF